MPPLNVVLILNLLLSMTLLSGVLILRPAFEGAAWKLAVHTLLACGAGGIVVLMLLAEHVAGGEIVPWPVLLRRAGPVVPLAFFNVAVWRWIWKTHGPSSLRDTCSSASAPSLRSARAASPPSVS